MAFSIFDIFKISIGPSSSHTMGPMRAAFAFAKELETREYLKKVDRLIVHLYGSLAATGIGHGTDKAIMLGLEGHQAETIIPEIIPKRSQEIKSGKSPINLLGIKDVAFNFKEDMIFHRLKNLPEHPNGMKIMAYDEAGNLLFEETYFSVGGGQIATLKQMTTKDTLKNKVKIPYDFESADRLLEICAKENKTISQVTFANELATRTEAEIRDKLDQIISEMNLCIERGLVHEGILPGKLKVPRRAPKIYQHLMKSEQILHDPLIVLDWVNLYAIAVNEENASGSRVVTAPTNGACGIIPAVLRYHQRFTPKATKETMHDFLLTAGAIGILYAKNASISGAEVGCQGEVGVACSMAAGGLVEALKGSVKQVEQAAEIGMEHNLGLTCDPIGGLVQIPCIERNAIGAVKAISAARIALREEGNHYVSLDSVIKTMYETGKDMKTKYKETSRGGLAVNVPEC